MSGIDISELKEAYPRVEEACMELSRKGELYLIRPKEDGPKVIFYNDYQAQITVDQNFKQLWGHVQVPADEFELRDALDRAGLKSCSRPSTSGPGAGSSVKRAEDKKKASSRPYRRRIKITNDYLEGIDLSLDPNHNQ